MSKLVTNILELKEKFKNTQPPTFLWRGIQEGNFGYIFGPPKCGKTTLCECLAISIASGANSFLESPLIINDPRVLIVSLEESDHYRYLRNEKQIKTIPNDKGQAWIKNLQLSTDEFPKSIVRKQDWQLLREIIIESKASTVFIDSLSHMASGPIEESTRAMKLSRKLREISRDLKVTLIVVHHSTKLGGNEMSMDSMAGSRVVAQECDFIMGMNIVMKRPMLRDIGVRYAASQKEDLYLNIDKNQWVHTDSGIYSLEDTYSKDR
ncbi:MAG: AAA family ATPase, partial [Chitinophagales bacterium]